MHRGADVALNVGDPVKAGMAGVVSRLHRTHNGFETSTQMLYWVEVDPGNQGVFTQSGSDLVIVGTRGGATTFPTGTANFIAKSERVDISTGDWEIRGYWTFGSITGGAYGFGFYDPVNTAQHAVVEYDGTTATARGNHAAGAMAANGTTLTTSGPYFSVAFTQATATIVWRASADMTTWTTIASQATVAFTAAGRPCFVPVVFWRATDTNAAVQTAKFGFISWFDSQGIGRFGNWLTISTANQKTNQMHFQDLLVELGDIVESGQTIGLAGLTGFDTRSGFITSPHVHFEYIPNNKFPYNQDESINPLAPGILPRSNTSANVTCTRTTANDPDGTTCWKLAISVNRVDQDFDLNSVSLTANLATRTINLNTRAGLNADNDVPKQGGVYIVPATFTSSSSAFAVDVYFSKAVVGSTFTSLVIADTAGTTLYSE